MENLRCGIFGSPPEYFAWGYNEEHARCKGLKHRLAREIARQREKGVTCFAVAMDGGVGLYAAEEINRLREEEPGLSLICRVPYEEQAAKWPPELQARYYNTLADCTEVVTLSARPSPGCVGKTRMATAEYADVMIIVRSREEPEDEIEVLYDVIRHKGCWVVDVYPPDRRVAK